MASIEEFSTVAGETLDDFSLGKSLTAPAVSRSSNLNMASYATAISDSPETAVDTYRAINAELDATGSSQIADTLVTEVRNKSAQLNTKQLINVLADPSYTDEQKKAMALSALDQNSAQYDVRNLVSMEALSAPVRNEEPRAENARVDVGAIIGRVNEFKRQEQAILNSELNKEDPETIKKVGDFLGYLAPFGEQKVAGTILSKMRDGDPTAYGEALLLLGSAKMDMREMLERTPVEDRLALTQSVVEIINSSSTIILPDGNDFARKDYLQTVLDQGAYDNVDKWIDNTISILDMTFIGGLLGRGAKAGLQGTAVAERASEVMGNVQRRLVKSRVQPTTLSQTYKDTNPDKARATFDAAVVDDTGEASQALYGASREDAIANDVLPEITNPDASVVAKTYVPEKNLEVSESVDPNIADFVKDDGAIYYFNDEKAQARAAAVNRFENVVGMNARKEMFQINEVGGGVNIRAVYGPTEGGFASAEDAVNMATWALRDSGVKPEQIKLLERRGSEYVEMAPEEYQPLLHTGVVAEHISGAKMTISVKRKSPDVLVAVDHNYKFNPGDVAQWSEADVKYNIFDRLGLLTGSSGQGSLQQHMLDAHSMLHPKITLGASVAVDKAAGLEKELLEVGKVFSDGFSKADEPRKALMQKLILEANDKGVDFNYNQMIAEGLRDSEIAAMQQWRKYWDTMYYLENKDFAKTLKARGYMEYVDEVGDTRLFAKPIHRTQTGKVGKAYNPTTGEIERLSNEQVKAMYDAGGTYAQLRSPMSIGDETVEFITTANSPADSYLRAITDDTQVLNYRKGYYSVHYKDPYFIVERVKNSKGEVQYERAISTAGSRKDAEAWAKSKAANDGKTYNDDFFVRGDIKKVDTGSNDHWDVQQVSGRSAQRIRGKRLEEADTNVPSPAQSNILDPVESMTVSARSIAHRTSMRDMLETTKTRFVSQYGDFLPTGDFGQKVMPATVKDVRYYGGPENKKKMADAITTYNYIKYLEDGYVNAIDESYKATLKSIADIAGNVGLNNVDKGLRWMSEGRGPSAMAKNLAFNMYLALNPLRQFVVQSHQAVQLAALNPRWIANADAVPQITLLMMKQMGAPVPEAFLKGAGFTAESAEEMFQQFKKTGQVAAIDKQNLVRGSLLNLADQTNLGKTLVGRTWQYTTAPITWSRRVGFDAGELVNTMSAWLANRDLAIRAGKDMKDAAVQAEVAGAARNFTYNMNAAGDLPYNQNTLAAVFQFQQVPHKAITTMTTNRVLTPAQKLRLAGFNAVMYTLPPAAMYSWFGESGADILPKDQAARDLVVQGLEGYTLNKLLSLASGEESSVDWSGLSPVDMYGTMDFIHSLFTTDVGTIIASTPSGQLLFGNNPRLTNFAKSSARYFNLVDDYQDPTVFGQVATDFFKLSSGFSNAYKAAYVLEYGKKYGTLGGNTHSNVPTPNAIALVFGFQSLADAQTRYVNDTLYNKSKDLEKDVKEYYKQAKNHLLSKEPGMDSSQLALKLTGEAWRVWGNDNIRAKQLLMGELRRDMQDKDVRLYQRVLRDNNMLNSAEMENLMRAVPYKDEAQRQRALETFKYMDQYKDEDK
ncbi:hypothetical protein D3C77_37770 [compost metagenome]